MSNSEGWLKKFYPKPAAETRGLKMSEVVQHSLTKWKGLLELADFGLKQLQGRPIIVDGLGLWVLTVDDSSCSLCINYWRASRGQPSSHPRRMLGGICRTCPVRHVNDGFRCNGHFETWVDTGDPRPMVDLLELTLNYALFVEQGGKPEDFHAMREGDHDEGGLTCEATPK